MSHHDGVRHRGGVAPGASVRHDDDEQKKQKKGLSEDSGVAQKLKQFLPQVLKVMFAAEKVVEQGIHLAGIAKGVYDKNYAKFAQYNPHAIVGMFTGFVLIFFGGLFIVTVAMVEAFKQGGSHILIANLKLLQAQLLAVEKASEEDDKVDDDGDGIPDVQQITAEELASRKVIVAIKAMDPFVVQEALGALWTSTVSAAATVKLQFARTVALGITIGDTLNRPVQRYFVPLLMAFTDPVYHKWYPSVFGYICKSIGATIAFQIQRVLSTVSTGMRGGHMVIDNFADFCETRGLTYLSEGYLDDIAAWVLVVVGIYFQLFVLTYLPFIFKLILFPMFITEWLLTTLVTTV